MSTKSTRIARTVRPGIKSRLPITPAPAVRPVQIVLVRREYVEFLDPSGAVSSRMAYGPQNSDAFAAVAKRLIAIQESGVLVKIVEVA